MIVNPQLLNYRLITGSLVIAIAFLSFYSISNYKSSKAQQEFLEQEKSLIAGELSQMLTQYNGISVENDLILSQLEDAKRTAQKALDSIDILKGDIAVYSRYRKQLAELRVQNTQLFKSVDSLKNITLTLTKDNEKVRYALSEERAENEQLKEENDQLISKIDIASKFYASNLNVKAYHVKKGHRYETNRATNAESIEICMSLTENVLTQAGEKEIYIQIVNPKNNVVADKGAVEFDDASLIYSEKKIIYYNNEAKDLCINVEADPNDKPLEKGLYHINVFHKDRKIANTKIILD